MNRAEVMVLLDRMFDMWPHQELNRQQVEMYVRGLMDFDPDGVVKVLDRMAMTEEFLPSIPKIRRGYYQMVGLGNPEAAWEQLDRIVRERDIDPYWHDRDGLDPIGVAVLMSLGGMPELRRSERPEFLRGEFIRAYERRYREELAEPDVAAEALRLGSVQKVLDSPKPELGQGQGGGE